MYIANTFLDPTNEEHNRLIKNIRYNIIGIVTNRTNSREVANKVSEYLDANLLLTNNPVGESDVIRFRDAYIEEVCKSYNGELNGFFNDFLNDPALAEEKIDIDLFSEKFLSFSCYLFPGAYSAINAIYEGKDLNTVINSIPGGLIVNQEIYGSDFINSDEANWRLYSMLNQVNSPFANMDYIKYMVGNLDGSRPMEDAYSEHKHAIARICEDNPYTSNAIAKMKENYDKLGDKSFSEEELSSIACEWAETAAAFILLNGEYIE